MKTTLDKNINRLFKGFRERLIWVILALIIIIIMCYTAHPRSFESMILSDFTELKVIVVPLKVTEFSGSLKEQSSEIRDRVFNKLNQYQYRKTWFPKPKEVSGETEIYMSIKTNDGTYYVELISNGEMMLSNNRRNEYYSVIGGRKLYDEVFELIRAGSFDRSEAVGLCMNKE